ncbi:hypothetical protein ARMSODRAFT_978167 [Armillaria solidipes]|uniref:Aminoglycoside phosphotransferase domain-containing protein n=1 Tax=Armillaria solidipes TaxID=1076256 RepID=A0A2H3B4B7_9AGAR|nr:hypothetical protein ARMSODRAFT_978167 [Armillaria solidipes]
MTAQPGIPNVLDIVPDTPAGTPLSMGMVLTKEPKLEALQQYPQFHETILSEVAPKGHYFDAPKRIMKQHRLCFSHLNLTRENILVTGDGRLATIINWEVAGWFPDYWDYALVDKPVSLAEARVLNQFWTAVGVFGEGRYDENPEHYSDG